MTHREASAIAAQGFNGYVDFTLDDVRVLLDGMFTSDQLMALATMLDRSRDVNENGQEAH